MARYTFDMSIPPDNLPGWQDVLSCPFCLGIAVECIRLPHSEPDRDCGVCACAECVQEWVVFCDNADLVCPRCRYPICAVHLKDVCNRPNPRDPLIARLVADVLAQCPYCDMKGTVSSMTSHANGHRAERQLIKLQRADNIIKQQGALPLPGFGVQWVNAFVALHALAPTDAFRYLVQWLASVDVHVYGALLIPSLFLR